MKEGEEKGERVRCSPTRLSRSRGTWGCSRKKSREARGEGEERGEKRRGGRLKTCGGRGSQLAVRMMFRPLEPGAVKLARPLRWQTTWRALESHDPPLPRLSHPR